MPEDQLLLGLEEAEQVEAAGHAAEEAEPAKKTAPPARAARVPCIRSARTCPSAST
ncbi:hypothetical protein [Methylobacterium mesophilicum]